MSWHFSQLELSNLERGRFVACGEHSLPARGRLSLELGGGLSQVVTTHAVCMILSVSLVGLTCSCRAALLRNLEQWAGLCSSWCRRIRNGPVRRLCRTLLAGPCSIVSAFKCDLEPSDPLAVGAGVGWMSGARSVGAGVG